MAQVPRRMWVVTDNLPATLEFISATSGGNAIGSANGQNYSATIRDPRVPGHYEHLLLPVFDQTPTVRPSLNTAISPPAIRIRTRWTTQYGN